MGLFDRVPVAIVCFHSAILICQCVRLSFPKNKFQADETFRLDAFDYHLVSVATLLYPCVHEVTKNENVDRIRICEFIETSHDIHILIYIYIYIHMQI